MSQTDRPGISEKWLKIAEKPGKRKSPYAAPQVASQIVALEYFVAHGVSHQQLAAGAIAGSITPKSPPERAWEAYLHVDLHVYGAIRLCDWEIKGLNAQVCPVKQLLQTVTERLFVPKPAKLLFSP